jgi:hypothetical protein
VYWVSIGEDAETRIPRLARVASAEANALIDLLLHDAEIGSLPGTGTRGKDKLQRFDANLAPEFNEIGPERAVVGDRRLVIL